MGTSLGNVPSPGSISILELLFVASFVAGGLVMAAILLAAIALAPRERRKSPRAAGTAPPATPENHVPVSFRDRLDVVVYAGLGGFSSFCLFQGLFGEHGLITHPEIKEIVTMAILLPLAVWIELQFLHPRLERRLAAAGRPAHHPEIRFGRWDIRGTLALVLIFAVMDLVQHFAHKDLKYILASVGCCGITWLWVWGAGTSRGRAAVLGGAGGLALGMTGLASLFYLIHSGLFPDPWLPADRLLPSEDARTFLFRTLLIILGGGLLCGACGAGGGALIALLRGTKPVRRRTALAGALGGAALWVLFTAASIAPGYAGAPSSLPTNLAIPDGGIGAADVRMMVISLMIMDLLGGALYWAALGGAGGLWIDRSQSGRPMMGLLLVFPLVKVGYSAAQLALGFGAQWLILGKDFWGAVQPGALLLDFGAGLAVLLGWALGLMFCPSSDLVLGRRAV